MKYTLPCLVVLFHYLGPMVGQLVAVLEANQIGALLLLCLVLALGPQIGRRGTTESAEAMQSLCLWLFFCGTALPPF